MLHGKTRYALKILKQESTFLLAHISKIALKYGDEVHLQHCLSPVI